MARQFMGPLSALLLSLSEQERRKQAGFRTVPELGASQGYSTPMGATKPDVFATPELDFGEASYDPNILAQELAAARGTKSRYRTEPSVSETMTNQMAEPTPDLMRTQAVAPKREPFTGYTGPTAPGVRREPETTYRTGPLEFGSSPLMGGDELPAQYREGYVGPKRSWWQKLGGLKGVLGIGAGIYGLSRLRGGARESLGGVMQGAGQGLMALAEDKRRRYEDKLAMEELARKRKMEDAELALRGREVSVKEKTAETTAGWRTASIANQGRRLNQADNRPLVREYNRVHYQNKIWSMDDQGNPVPMADLPKDPMDKLRLDTAQLAFDKADFEAKQRGEQYYTVNADGEDVILMNDDYPQASGYNKLKLVDFYSRHGFTLKPRRPEEAWGYQTTGAPSGTAGIIDLLGEPVPEGEPERMVPYEPPVTPFPGEPPAAYEQRYKAYLDRKAQADKLADDIERARSIAEASAKGTEAGKPPEKPTETEQKEQRENKTQEDFQKTLDGTDDDRERRIIAFEHYHNGRSAAMGNANWGDTLRDYGIRDPRTMSNAEKTAVYNAIAEQRGWAKVEDYEAEFGGKG